MDEIVWKYAGTGEFIDGIPARDLTRSDLARMNEDQNAAVEQSSLYRRAPRQVVAPPAAKEPVVASPPAKAPAGDTAETLPGIEEATQGDKER